MAKSSSSWGIDVGREAVKAVKLVSQGGEVEVEALEVLPYDVVLTAPDVDADEAIQLKLDELARKHDLRKSKIIASVPGNTAFARFAKLPPVDPKTIPKIVRFEAEQQIPFPIDEVEWDYQVFQDADTPDVKVGIFAITKERVMQFLSNYRAVDLRIDALTLSPVAVFNAFAYDTANDADANEEGTVYLDIGTLSTDVIIIEDGEIWLRTVPIGGNHFTEALVKQFKISFTKAEKLKREAATSKYAKQIFQAMRSIFADMVQEIQRSIGFYQSMNRDSQLGKVVGLGSTFKLPGLQKFLKQQLQMDVVKPGAWARASIDGKRESELVGQVHTLSTAYGLALQGLGVEKVSANILPAHVLQQRMWQAKQPWIAAAAACVALGSGLYGARYFADRAELTEARAAVAQIVRPVLADANRFRSEAEEAITQDPRQGVQNLRQVLPNRDVFPRLLADLDAAIASVGTQPAVASGVAEQMATVPRRQRRQLFVTSVQTRFEAVPEAEEQVDAFGGPVGFGGASTGDFTSQGGSNPGSFDEFDEFGLEAVGPPTTLSEMVSQAAAKNFFAEEDRPAIEVTVRGTTPFENPSNLLRTTLVQWLRDNADRPDFPYTIEVGEDPLKFLAQVQSTGTGETGRNARPPRRPAGGVGDRPARRSGGGFGGGGGFDDGGFGDGGFGGGVGGEPRMDVNALRQINLAELLPQRPLALEDSSTDFEFEIVFSIELRDPLATSGSPSQNTDAPQDPSGEFGPSAGSPEGLPVGLAHPSNRDEVNS